MGSGVKVALALVYCMLVPTNVICGLHSVTMAESLCGVNSSTVRSVVPYGNAICSWK